MRRPWSPPSLALAASLGLALGLVPGLAEAGQPELDRVAAESGIAAGALTIGEREDVPAGSALRGISAERRSLSLHGLPLRGAFETVWIEHDGSSRVVASRYPGAPAKLQPEAAEIDLASARARLDERLQPDQRERLDRGASLHAQLVYLLVGETPHLAWEFTTPLHIGPRPSRERVWVSAADGRILDAVELVDFDELAEVYEFNPVHTPAPIIVSLTDLDPEPQPWLEGQVVEPGFLTGHRVRVFNCIDEEDGPYASWHAEGECWPTQQTRADDNGDFFVPLPDVGVLSDNKQPSDLYSELSMYYHAEKFFSHMAELGVEEFPCELSNMVANFHWLEPAPAYPELGFGPYNNAYYSGACEIEDGPTMLFGQGSEIDFAYDGDVVYHELGHGIVAMLTPAGLRGVNMRSDGVLNDARGINEAMADYHTIMVSERPELGDYAGFYWSDLGRAWIRYADSEATCPHHMAGQPHNDSAPLTSALWAARHRVGGAKLDPVVLASLPLLPGDATLEQMAAALVEVASAEHEAGVWSDWDIDQLERALASRNLFDCERVIDNPVGLDDDKFLYLRGKTNSVSPFWPGPVQFRQRIPAGSDNLLVTFEVSTEGNSAGQPVRYDVHPQLLVKRSSVSADAPLQFEYVDVALGHHDGEDGNINQAWEVSGDWDEIVASTVLGEKRRQILIRGLEPGEVLHLGFTNTDRETVVVRELEFASLPSEALDEGSPVDGRPEELELDDGSGCACTATESRDKARGSAITALLLAALGRRRRRRS